MSILNSRASGAVLLADDIALAEGMDALAARRSGRPPSRDGARTLARWMRAGLLLEKRRPWPDPVRPRPARVEARLYALGDRRAALCSEAPDIAADLNAVLAPLRSEDGDGITGRIDVLVDEGRFAVIRDGEPVFGRTDVSVARHLALREILIALHGPDRVAAVLHAAAVERAGRALLLAGDSGAGKSSLSLALLGEGWRLTTDDLAAVTPEGALLPFPTPISLKPGTRNLLPPAAKAKTTPGGVGAFEIAYLSPPATTPADAKVRAEAILFPRFALGTAPALERLSPETAFARLFACGARVVGVSGSIGPLARLVRDTPAFALAYGDTASALRLCASVRETIA